MKQWMFGSIVAIAVVGSVMFGSARPQGQARDLSGQTELQRGSGAPAASSCTILPSRIGFTYVDYNTADVYVCRKNNEGSASWVKSTAGVLVIPALACPSGQSSAVTWSVDDTGTLTPAATACM